MRPLQNGTATPDALLVHRIAALSDRTALAELDARHGMTLYALAYGSVFDREAADLVVAAAFREVWRSAARFDPQTTTVKQWLTDLTRRAARLRLEGLATHLDWTAPLLVA